MFGKQQELSTEQKTAHAQTKDMKSQHRATRIKPKKNPLQKKPRQVPIRMNKERKIRCCYSPK